MFGSVLLILLMAGEAPPASEEAKRAAVVERPHWIGKPDGMAVNLHYPDLAERLEVGGRLKLRCTATETGHVVDCKVSDETPAGLGFGDAAIALSQYFQMRPTTNDGQPVAGASVSIPIVFSPAEESSAPRPESYRAALACVTWNRVRLDVLGDDAETAASLAEAKRHARALAAAEGLPSATVDADLAMAGAGGESGRAAMSNPQAQGSLCRFRPE